MHRNNLENKDLDAAKPPLQKNTKTIYSLRCIPVALIMEWQLN